MANAIISIYVYNEEIGVKEYADFPGEPLISIGGETTLFFKTTEKLEELFTLIDKFLHDEKETSAAWQDRALKSEIECEHKDDRIAFLEEQIDMFRHKG